MEGGRGDALGATVLPTVSIVLPVYNSSKELASTMVELEKQSYTNREITIVDDGSTDDTWEIAKSLGGGRSDVHIVHTDHKGASHARNTGVNESKGEVVFFAESDCIYDTMYLNRAVDALDGHPEAGAVCLTGAPLMIKSTLATECIDVENKVQHRLLAEGRIKPFYAWVYRRDVLLKLGGFDERLFQAEDKDLFKRLETAGYKVLWVPGIHWRHKRDQTTFELARKWFARGRSRILYALKHRLTLDIVKAVVPFWATVFSIIVLLISPVLGALLLSAILAVFVMYSLRVISISWPLVRRKRVFLGYPIFLLVRNLSTGMGYSSAVGTILVRKLQGREISWSNV
jgi:glycosyltransferase involved in cell wall biosynthesis